MIYGIIIAFIGYGIRLSKYFTQTKNLGESINNKIALVKGVFYETAQDDWNN